MRLRGSWEVYQDRAALSELPPTIATVLERHGLTDQTTRSVQFVGCIAFKDYQVAFVPLGVLERASTKNIWDYLRLVMNVLDESERYLPQAHTIPSEDDDQRVEIVSVARDLFEEYAAHGLHTQRAPRYERGRSGTVSWSRTIARSVPFIVDDVTPVYPETVVRRVVSSETSLLRRAQETALREIWDVLWWWLIIATGVDLPKTVQVRLLPNERNSLLEQLYAYRDRRYDDRGLRLIELLIRYFQASQLEEGADKIFGSASFEHVWEEMLKRILGVVESPWMGRTPKIAYRYKDEHSASVLGFRLDPDFVIEADGEVLLLDAKYYAATDSKTSPPLADVYKQMAYQMALESRLASMGRPETRIRNAFLFPSSPSGGPWKDLAFILNDGAHANSLIEYLYLDTEDVMRAYLKDARLSLDTLVR